MLKARYTMIGGFLGAGKTTAILAIAKRLTDQGLRVGLISNDQSVGLVDTTMFGAQGLATEEISGGCFCCKFDSLVQASERLTADASPNVFLAEPVGSCTDLQATVGYPLRKLYGEHFNVSPLSVLVDPIRAQRILGLLEGKSFSPKVSYIYCKQLEEADLIVINKCDLLEESDLDELQRELEQRFPQSEVLRISARHGDGLDQWMDRMEQEGPATRKIMDVDYDIYAEGEALLGWVNVSATLTGDDLDGNALLHELLTSINQQLNEQSIEVAHLKATLAPSEGLDLAVANVVRQASEVELAYELNAPIAAGQLLVNLRAEGDPQDLKSIVEDELQKVSSKFSANSEIRHAEAFRPAPPQPTHRVTCAD
ncbi:GTP-binding protein [Aeoliella mucimassa]|uniref:Metal chaperone YciC n=1 Tax=Aeoliella mucimassa TaxID=2527972 RepID=A0A518AP75_9BACT|nr:GTP-binding protein [Aeoliella mucimassa]QDU56523.1 Putative metal chaperone YciC [Aeoliella mucimassa]